MPRVSCRRVTLATLAIAALAGLFLLDPAVCRLFPPCPLHALTGAYCPGCGSLRAMHRLLHGDLAGAFRLNALAILSVPVLGLLALRPSWTRRAWTPWLCLGVLVLYGIFRNVGAWPFVLLAPH